MAFQPINFASIPVQGDPGARGLSDAFNNMLNTGFKTYGMLQQNDQLAAQKQMQQVQLQQALQKVKKEKMMQDLIFGSNDPSQPSNPSGATGDFQVPMQLPQQGSQQNGGASVSPEEKHALLRKLLGIPDELSGDKEQRAKNIIDYKRNQDTKDPFANVGMSGNIAQAIMLSMTKKRFGEDSEEYKNAKRIVDADISSKETLNSYRSGGTNSPASKAQTFFEKQVGLDNPQLTTPDSVRAAANALAANQGTLSDGTKLSFSPAARSALDAVVKGGTTANILNNRSTTQGREAEMPVINSYISKGLSPYGDTVFGMSPTLELDKLKSDDASQTKVGRFLASQQLNTERANIANALAQGPAGVTLVNQMIDEGKLRIKNPDLKISNKARQEAIRYYTEGIGKAVEARMRAPTNASSIVAPQKPSLENVLSPLKPQIKEMKSSREDPLGIR